MKKYPIGAEHYVLYEEIGQGVSASVYRAKCLANDDIVAVKVLDFERGNCDLNNVSREAQTMVLVDHPNVLKSHCSFVNDHNLWVVMPFMAGGSCLHMLKASHPEGFEEVVIATILREVLKALEYLHHHGHIHRDVKAGNILISDQGAIKLGDFGVSACLFDHGDRQRVRNTFVGTPCWMAPEVMEQLHGYDFKADIWSFGITALELAHGHAPFSKYPPMKVLLMTLQNAPPGLDYESDKKFSKSFKQMTASCLVKDPSKRPTAQKLLKHYFFKQARSNDFIARKLLEGLPTIGDRLQEIKKKDEDMLAQKKVPDGQKEEISQNEYKRGISGWNFDLEDLKAQASLIHDEEGVSEKYQIGSLNSFPRIIPSEWKLQHQLSSVTEASEIAEVEGSAPLGYSTMGFAITNCEKSEDELSVTNSINGQFSQNASPRTDNFSEFDLPGKRNMEFNGIPSRSHHRAASSGCIPSFDSEKLQGQFSRVPSYNGSRSLQIDDFAHDSMSKPSIASIASIASMASRVRQKGRFKVTSESVDLDKAAARPAPPVLQKSHSMQVISQNHIHQSNHVDGSPVPQNHLPLPALQFIMQTNTLQRDCISSLMKGNSTSDFTANFNIDGGCASTNIPLLDKSMLDANSNREKELLCEINYLQWRLACAQEELQKCRSENP